MLTIGYLHKKSIEKACLSMTAKEIPDYLHGTGRSTQKGCGLPRFLSEGFISNRKIKYRRQVKDMVLL